MEISFVSVPEEMESNCEHSLRSNYGSLVGGGTVQVTIGQTVSSASGSIKVDLRSGDPYTFGSNWQSQTEHHIPIAFHAVINALHNLSMWGRYEIAPSLTNSDVVEVTGL